MRPGWNFRGGLFTLLQCFCDAARPEHYAEISADSSRRATCRNSLGLSIMMLDDSPRPEHILNYLQGDPLWNYVNMGCERPEKVVIPLRV